MATCHECGELMHEDASGVTHHGEEGDVDFDADADHTPLNEADVHLPQNDPDNPGAQMSMAMKVNDIFNDRRKK